MTVEDAMKEWRVNVLEMYANQFATSKGRLPQNSAELVRWLLEFDEARTKLLDHYIKLFEDHLMTCYRPIIISNKDL